MERVGQEEARTGTVEIVSADDGCVEGGMMAAAVETRENGARRQVRRRRVSSIAPNICGRDGSDQSFCILCSYLAQNRKLYWTKEHLLDKHYIYDIDDLRDTPILGLCLEEAFPASAYWLGSTHLSSSSSY